MRRTNLLMPGLALALAACNPALATNDGSAGGGPAEAGHDSGSIDGTTGDEATFDAPSADVAAQPPGDDAAIGARPPGDDAGIGARPPSDGAAAGADADSLDAPSPGPCEVGAYLGPFAGLYTSHLTGVGIPIPIEGTVSLTLDAAGSAGTTCTLDGVNEDCSNLLSLQGATITGVADQTHGGDAAIGGFPFSCAITGALDCQANELVDGWIQCTYCVGALAAGGMACSLSGVGGHFAGPLEGSYDYGTHAFVMGSWNASEALAGNDGGSPGPDGGPLSNYLSDSGEYVGPNEFGGSGTWSATHQ